MNSRQIEQIAVNAVKDIFLQSEIFNPCIPDNDREPIWDGFIYIQNKNQTTIRIATQVKGKTAKKISKTPSYPIRISDLNAYKRDGGVIFFVVFITEEGNFVYHAKLAPIDIERYIKNAKGGVKVSVKLFTFSTNTLTIENDLRDFYRDCKKQTSFVGKKVLSLEEATKSKYKITITISGCDSKEEAIQKMISKPVYLYAEIGDNTVHTEYPIGDHPFSLYAGSHFMEDVSIDGKVYYNDYLMYLDGATTFVNIGNFLTIEISQIDNSYVVNKLKFESKNFKIDTHIHELEFLRDLIKYKILSYGKNKVQLKDISKTEIKKVEQEYKIWHRAKMLFNLTQIADNVDFNLFSDEDAACIDLLGKAIVDAKPIVQDHDLDTITTATFGKYTLLLLTQKMPNGKYKIQEFFQGIDKLVFAYESSNGNKLATSPFTFIFQRDDFTKITNIDYSKLIPSYEFAALYNSDIFNRATNDMLMALLAYDAQVQKNFKLLESMEELSNWILNNASNHKISHIINKFQIIKRKRNFTTDEKEMLMEVLNFPEINFDEQTAIHLLLDNKTMAECYFKKMETVQQNFFKSLPISFFMK